VAVPGAALGFERNRELLTSWFDQMVRPFVVDGKVTSEHANQSIPGVVFRLLTHSESDTVYDDDGKPIPADYRNVADIGPDAAKWVIRGCQFAFVAAVFFLCRAPLTRQRQGLAVAAELALVTLGMLLFSERTWKHHATTLMLPMAVLVGWWAMRPLGSAARLFTLGTVTLTAALMVVPSVVGGEFQDNCMIYGTHTAVFLLLTAGVCAVLGWERSTRRGE
jgi:alpha-1,2-mannosyltransferase